MASSLPPNCSSAARSLSNCFCVFSWAARRSMCLFSSQRENRIQPTATAATAKPMEEYSKGFLKTDFGGCPEPETMGLTEGLRAAARRAPLSLFDALAQVEGGFAVT